MTSWRPLKHFPFIGLLVGLLLLPVIRSAEAETLLSAKGGLSFASGDAQAGYSSVVPTLGAEIAFGVAEIIQFGVFYDYSLMTGSDLGTASVHFYGGVVRLGFGPLARFFFDSQLGRTFTSTPGGFSSDSTLGYGFGLGTTFSIGPLVSLRPRLGFRVLPMQFPSFSLGRTLIDAGVLLTISL